MIDIHNHLLARFDDGSRDMPETFTMCRVAALDGIRVIVATPHMMNLDSDESPESIREAVSRLNQALVQRGIPIDVMPGMEVLINASIPRFIAEGRILGLNDGRFVLMEFYPGVVPAGVDRLIRGIASLGYRTILGHPERNLAIQSDPSYVFDLVACFPKWELLVQISADSLTGQAGPFAQKTARTLLKNNLAHVIATDAHSPFIRAPRLSEALIVASDIVGRANARKMVWDIPMAVVGGKAFPDKWPEPRRIRWWQIPMRWGAEPED